LEKLQTILIIPHFFCPKFIELCHLFADLVANAKLSIVCDHFVVLLRLKLLVTQRIITHDLAADLLMLVTVGQADDRRAKSTLDLKRINDFLDDPGSTSDFDVLMADWAITIEQKPVFNAQFTE